MVSLGKSLHDFNKSTLEISHVCDREDKRLGLLGGFRKVSSTCCSPIQHNVEKPLLALAYVTTK